MVAKFPKQCSVQAARCFYRAAAELYQEKLDANASPNGEAQPGSPHHKKLMKAMSSFIRVMSSWAQMEFECRCVTLACIHCSLLLRLVAQVKVSVSVEQHGSRHGRSAHT